MAFTLKQLTPENKVLAKSSRWIRKSGGHTHYSCEGVKLITLSLQKFEVSSAEQLLAEAIAASGLELTVAPNP